MSALGTFLEEKTLALYMKAGLRLDRTQQKIGSMTFTMPADGNYAGLPQAIQRGVDAIKNNSAIQREELNFDADGLNLHIYLFKEQGKPELTIPGTALARFKIRQEDDTSIHIDFQAKAALDKQSGEFLVNHFGDQVYLVAEEMQENLPFDGEKPKKEAKAKPAEKAKGTKSKKKSKK